MNFSNLTNDSAWAAGSARRRALLESAFDFLLKAAAADRIAAMGRNPYVAEQMLIQFGRE